MGKLGKPVFVFEEVLHARVYLNVVRVGKYAVRFFQILMLDSFLNTCLFYLSSVTVCAVLLVWCCSCAHVSLLLDRNRFCKNALNRMISSVYVRKID